MRNILFLSVFSMLIFTAAVDAAPQESAKGGSGRIESRGKRMGLQPGHRNGPGDLIFFGLSRKGEEMKPFLLDIQLRPPRKPSSREEHVKQEKQQPLPGREPEKKPMPIMRRFFLGIDGKDHLLTSIEINFSVNQKALNGPPQVRSIKAAILDIIPLAIDPTELEKMTEEERHENVQPYLESVKTAKKIGVLELNFVMRNDLKSPIMTDMEILTAEGHATINGEEFALSLVSPPPPPRPGHPQSQPGQGGDNPPPSPEEGTN